MLRHSSSRDNLIVVLVSWVIMMCLYHVHFFPPPTCANPALAVMLERVKNRAGFQPNAVVDVGANHGAWSRGIRTLFPEAKILMVEATPMHDAPLKTVAQEIGNAEHRIAVVTARDGETVQFFQSRNTGNSMFREDSKHYANEKPVERTSETLDSIVAKSFLKNEIIDVVKADVQGAELAVFQGATKALSQATFVYMEASTVEYNAGAPCTYEVDEFLRSQGFFLYDQASFYYNEAFKTFGMGQYDVMYVKPDSPRLPQAMRDSGAKYCGHGKPQKISGSSRRGGGGFLVMQAGSWITWGSGVVCGIVSTLVMTRLLQPKYKRTL